MINDAGNFQINSTRQSGVTKAIALASAKTGVDFDYLMKQARVESSLNPNAKARTSSATGLYQFIDQTWLREMKQHGAEHGYGAYAEAIKQNANGEYYVPNRSQRAAILNLRKDPRAASLMAAELATDNNKFLQDSVGRTPNGTDLYMAHFLGAQGAANFLTSMKKNPWAPAASFFPEAARANKSVFYVQGRPLSLQQVYNKFDAKFSGTAQDDVTQVASSDMTIDLDHGDQGPSPVTLPEAITWNDPSTDMVQARAEETLAQMSSIRVLTDTSEEEKQAPRQTASWRVPDFQSSGYSMRHAASQYLHANQKRYNS